MTWPATAATCTDLGGVSRGAPALFFYQALFQRKDPISLRRRCFGYAVAALIAGVLLWTGVVATLATPLMVLAAVCGALGVIALLGSPADSYPE